MITLQAIMVDAIVGAGFGDYTVIEAGLRHGLIEDQGNQHNEKYVWNRAMLNNTPEKDLATLYAKIKELQYARQ